MSIEDNELIVWMGEQLRCPYDTAFWPSRCGAIGCSEDRAECWRKWFKFQKSLEADRDCCEGADPHHCPECKHRKECPVYMKD